MMPKVIQLNLSPDQAHLKQDIQKAISSHLNVSKENISDFRLIKRSIDARKRRFVFNLKLKFL